MRFDHLCIFFGVTLLFQFSQSQYFDPNLDDEEYLNLTQRKVKHEVVQSRQELVDQVEVVRSATRAFIGAKLKENLFKELRNLAERELETMSMQNRPRQPRQDEEDDEERTTAEPGLIPQLATIVQSIFGNNVNVTKYVESASLLLPRPIGTQLVGVISLLDPSQFTSTAAPQTNVGPVTSSPVKATAVVGTPEATTTVRPVEFSGNEGDDYDDLHSEEDLRRKRQFNLKGINPLSLINGMEGLWNNYGKPVNNATTPLTVTYLKAGSTTESDDGFDDDYTTKPSRVTTAVQGVRTQVDALRKGVPDLFQGAREAYKFLETLNGFLDNWESRLQPAPEDDEEEE